MNTILLPDTEGGYREYRPNSAPLPPLTCGPAQSRTFFAAAHVVAEPLRVCAGAGPEVDWDATLAFRHRLWAQGLGVAEAMDTAQRGMGLDWPTAAELIRRSAAEARAVGGRIVCGVGTDQLTAPGPHSIARITAAYAEQLAHSEACGSAAVLMASRALAKAARGPEDYLEVYGQLLRQSSTPVVLHWLGAMFDPELTGYWGHEDPEEATEVFLKIITEYPGKVAGIKVSLLDADREVDIRRRLPAGVRCYTGDDHHYPELIGGDGELASDALLGIFDPIAPIAARAAQALDRGDAVAFRALLDPTVALARHLFAPPTRYYKTGVVLLAWLAGYQEHFTMLGGLQSGRSLPHLATTYELADRLGLFPDPGLAEARMRQLFAVYGVAS
ncbi:MULTISPECIES: dihydrodipicolinate synthase family protein [unclassified Streptomyces]|uniref:dihydrodipicolinate synthase family protein n=1 Tax=unclassified Streptomyces TaxID=2593676 RepID=UPI002E340FA1|nr:MULTISPECIES: dihydrodipicolinate synthase family protein [unclassified Streptomyces]WUC63439.1 dihydrodipicolinate synthase family protein [Streptomyces sp. NBC_00539]